MPDIPNWAMKAAQRGFKALFPNPVPSETAARISVGHLALIITEAHAAEEKQT